MAFTSTNILKQAFTAMPSVSGQSCGVDQGRARLVA